MQKFLTLTLNYDVNYNNCIHDRWMLLGENKASQCLPGILKSSSALNLLKAGKMLLAACCHTSSISSVLRFCSSVEFELALSVNGSPRCVVRWASTTCTQNAVKAFIYNFHCSLFLDVGQRQKMVPRKQNKTKQNKRFKMTLLSPLKKHTVLRRFRTINILATGWMTSSILNIISTFPIWK